jgi:hypothetical protein
VNGEYPDWNIQSFEYWVLAGVCLPTGTERSGGGPERGGNGEYPDWNIQLFKSNMAGVCVPAYPGGA